MRTFPKTYIHLLLVAAVGALGFGCQSRLVPDSPQAPTSWSNTSEQSKGQLPEPQNVKFESADKVEIVGTYYAAEKDDSPAVLLLHQWQSDRKSFESFAARLQAKGFSVLAIDGRGFGGSVKTTDGKPVTAGRDEASVKSMLADVANAVKFLSAEQRVDPSRIAIVGASYGSSLAIIYAAENKDLKAVALLSPGINYFGSMKTEPAVKSFGDRPLLMVAADDDSESADAVRKLKQAGGKDLYETEIYPKGGHGTTLLYAGVGLEDRLEGFLEKSLK